MPNMFDGIFTLHTSSIYWVSYLGYPFIDCAGAVFIDSFLDLFYAFLMCYRSFTGAYTEPIELPINGTFKRTIGIVSVVASVLCGLSSTLAAIGAMRIIYYILDVLT